MSTAAVGLFEAKTHLSEYVARAERGEEVIITRHNKPVAKIVPLHAKPEVAAKDIPPFIQKTYDMGVPLVDLTKANQLVGEMEDQHFLELTRRLEAEIVAKKKNSPE
ncbi:MAG: type II toxin-antitoxin system prevent-host-death family antitoxin [Proteobacteria bacterium]|nr:type II toxin-antitoxin system prevent-host-death family antitoxin [Pseudomonadota bacterium]